MNQNSGCKWLSFEWQWGYDTLMEVTQPAVKSIALEQAELSLYYNWFEKASSLQRNAFYVLMYTITNNVLVYIGTVFYSK